MKKTIVTLVFGALVAAGAYVADLVDVNEAVKIAFNKDEAARYCRVLLLDEELSE